VSVKRSRHTPGQIIRKLRDVDRLLAGGKTTGEVARELGVFEATLRRWRNQ
jgi:transposase-like protein